MMNIKSGKMVNLHLKGIEPWGKKQTEYFREIEKYILEISRKYALSEVKLPQIEYAKLFQQSLDASTDIIHKEMFVFQDRGNRTLCLKPEGTVSLLHAYLSQKWHQENHPARYFYLDSFFRAERPQKGRYREFHQYGIEILGNAHPLADAEVMALGYTLFQQLGLSQTELHMYSLGCHQCRSPYVEELRAFLSPKKHELCRECRLRYENNPLRILDCKNETCQALLTGMPEMQEYLCTDCAEHFQEVQTFLGVWNIPYELNPKMVRGLDYYSRTTFEFIDTSGTLGAQSTIGGGGRYDRLLELWDISPAFGVGMAIGLERLLLLFQATKQDIKHPESMYYFIAFPEVPSTYWADIVRELRMQGKKVFIDTQFHLALKKRLANADAFQANFVILVGEQEYQKGIFISRDMSSGHQTEVSIAEML